MLNARYLESTISVQPMHAPSWSVKDKTEVKRIAPKLRPVATILEGETGLYKGKLGAVVYPMPDGELVRVPLSGRGGYEYDRARYLPQNHSIVLAHAKNPDVTIEVEPSPEDHAGSLLNDRDQAWLKSTLDAQLERDRKELRAQGLIP